MQAVLNGETVWTAHIFNSYTSLSHTPPEFGRSATGSPRVLARVLFAQPCMLICVAKLSPDPFTARAWDHRSLEGARRLYSERSQLSMLYQNCEGYEAVQSPGRLAGFYAGVGLNCVKVLPEIAVRTPELCVCGWVCARVLRASQTGKAWFSRKL